MCGGRNVALAKKGALEKCKARALCSPGPEGRVEAAEMRSRAGRGLAPQSLSAGERSAVASRTLAAGCQRPALDASAVWGLGSPDIAPVEMGSSVLVTALADGTNEPVWSFACRELHARYIDSLPIQAAWNLLSKVPWSANSSRHQQRRTCMRVNIVALPGLGPLADR